MYTKNTTFRFGFFKYEDYIWQFEKKTFASAGTTAKHLKKYDRILIQRVYFAYAIQLNVLLPRKN